MSLLPEQATPYIQKGKRISIRMCTGLYNSVIIRTYQMSQTRHTFQIAFSSPSTIHVLRCPLLQYQMPPRPTHVQLVCTRWIKKLPELAYFTKT